MDAAIRNALAGIEKMMASVKNVVLVSPANPESVRVAVLASEAYAYHYELVNKTPELYQPETLFRVRNGATVTTLAYIQGRRGLAQARRVIEQIFDTVDVLVTPTSAVLAPTIAEYTTDVSTSVRQGVIRTRNTSPFNIYGIPTISVPCGFSSKGLPIGLQISARNGAEEVVLQLASVYERATDWHKRSPDVGRSA